MKIVHLFVALFVLFGLLFMSCKKSKGPGTFAAFDLSLVDSGIFQPGGRATVIVNTSTLQDGTYTLYYYLFPNRSFTLSHTQHHATLVLSNHTGTFQTDPLDSPNYVILQADSLVNGAGDHANVNSLAAFTDSTGIMNAQMNGVNIFRTANVTATNGGGVTVLQAFLPQAGSLSQFRVFTLYLYATSGVLSLNNTIGYPGAYGVSVDNGINMDYFVHGTVVIATPAPLFTGSFSVTCTDSSVMTGTFSCPAP